MPPPPPPPPRGVSLRPILPFVQLHFAFRICPGSGLGNVVGLTDWWQVAPVRPGRLQVYRASQGEERPRLNHSGSVVWRGLFQPVTQFWAP